MAQRSTHSRSTAHFAALDAAGRPALRSIKALLRKDFPECAHLQDYDKLLEATLSAAETVGPAVEESGKSQFRLLFDLAGFLKGVFDPASELDEVDLDAVSIFALVFVAMLLRRGQLSDSHKYIDWNSPEEVRLAFAAAWTDRKFPKGTALLRLAHREAMGTSPLALSGPYGRVLAMAKYLQEAQPGVPIFLAVSESNARALGMALATLWASLKQAIRRGAITVTEVRPEGSRRARRLSVNLDHADFATQGIGKKGVRKA